MARSIGILGVAGLLGSGLLSPEGLDPYPPAQRKRPRDFVYDIRKIGAKDRARMEKAKKSANSEKSDLASFNTMEKPQ